MCLTECRMSTALKILLGKRIETCVVVYFKTYTQQPHSNVSTMIAVHVCFNPEMLVTMHSVQIFLQPNNPISNA